MTGARVERGRSGRPGRGLSLDRIVSVPLELMDEQGIGAATRTENVATDRERQECGPSPIRRQIAEYARLPRHSASQLGSAQITHSRATARPQRAARTAPAGTAPRAAAPAQAPAAPGTASSPAAHTTAANTRTLRGLIMSLTPTRPARTQLHLNDRQRRRDSNTGTALRTTGTPASIVGGQEPALIPANDPRPGRLWSRPTPPLHPK